MNIQRDRERDCEMNKTKTKITNKKKAETGKNSYTQNNISEKL